MGWTLDAVTVLALYEGLVHALRTFRGPARERMVLTSCLLAGWLVGAGAFTREEIFAHADREAEAGSKDLAAAVRRTLDPILANLGAGSAIGGVSPPVVAPPATPAPVPDPTAEPEVVPDPKDAPGGEGGGP